MPQPPWQTPYGIYEQNGRGNGNGHYIGELRERMSAVERDAVHLNQRQTETVERVTEGEQRSRLLAHRVTNLEMINSGRSSLDSKLEEIPDRMLTAEQDLKYLRERLKLILLAILALLAGAGWLPTDLKRSLLHGLLPPGIG